MPEFKKFSQFTKVEEGADGTPVVWGIATLEAPDLDREICRYSTAKPVYQAWSAAAMERTAKSGQELSLGNIRLMHGLDAGGKAVKLEFDDANKRVMLGSVPISDDVYKALKGGFYTGYSQGGSYAARECAECESAMPMQQGANYCKRCGKDVDVIYDLASLSEVSYVDSPCTGEGFEHVKANGSREIVKFAKRSVAVEQTPEQIKADADAKKAAAKAKAKTEFDAALDKATTTAGLNKGLYQVANLAEYLQGLARMYEGAVYERDMEGDGSSVPEDLKEILDQFIEVFIDMATEEAKELAAQTASVKTTTTKGGTMPEQNDELMKAAKKSLAKHFAKAAAHHTKLAKSHEAKADHHEELSKLHKSAHETMKAADVSGGEPGASEGYGEAVESQIEFHKGAEKCHKGLAAEHDKICKAHEDHAEHCTKMAEEHDKEEATKVASESGAVVAKTESTKTAPVAESEFERKAIAKAHESLLADADFMADVKKRQRDMLLEKMAGEGLSGMVEPTAVKSAGPQIVPRAGQNFEFAKSSGPTENDCGI